MSGKRVILRDDHFGDDIRRLEAYLDEAGNLRLDGHDLGPGTAIVSDDGEYEWVETIATSDLPRLVELLGGTPGEDILDLLSRRYTGAAAGEFTRILYDSGIPIKRMVW